MATLRTLLLSICFSKAEEALVAAEAVVRTNQPSPNHGLETCCDMFRVHTTSQGLVDALNTIVGSLSGSGSASLLQSRASAVDDSVADSCGYLATYAVPVFGEGNLHEMLTELLVSRQDLRTRAKDRHVGMFHD